MRYSQKDPSHVLIVLPRQLGDILLGSSLAFALKKRLPHATIRWVSHPMGRQLLEGHPALTEVLYHPVWKKRSIGQWFIHPLNTLLAFINYLFAEMVFLKSLRAQNFELVIDCICTPKTALMTFVTGAKRRHGIQTRWNRNWAYTWRCDTSQWGKIYTAQARLNLLEPLLGFNAVSQPDPAWLDSWIPEPSESVSQMNKLLNNLNLEKHNFAVLSPTSRRPLRQWPGASFVELGLQLIIQHQLKICWFYGPGEFEFTDELHRQLQFKLKQLGLDPSASCLPPLLTLSEAAIVSGLSAVWIGNTNGLSHVAVAGGARTVQIYGPTSGDAWTHPDRTKHRAVQRKEGCVRCESNHCRTGTHECMKLLTVDEVLQAVKTIKTACAH